MVYARIGHLGIEVSDVAASRKFYDSLLGSLGFRLISGSEVYAGYSDGSTQAWISRSVPRRVTRQPPSGDEDVVSEHIDFLVEDRVAVELGTSGMERRGFSPIFPPEEHPEFVEGTTQPPSRIRIAALRNRDLRCRSQEGVGSALRLMPVRALGRATLSMHILWPRTPADGLPDLEDSRSDQADLLKSITCASSTSCVEDLVCRRC